MKILIYSLFITQIAFSSQYPNKVVRNEAKYLRKCFSIIQKKIDNQKEENNKVNNNFNGFLGGTKIEFCVDCYLKEKRSKSENEFVNGLSHVERNKFYDLVKIKINKHHPKISDELIRLIK
ncbi:MAG: hypothetical protein KA174_04090 [Chitinophagales bacterium]|jgi:hypothetical protein|nr:hypothetical protein [Chitinophagales bacterium]